MPAVDKVGIDKLTESNWPVWKFQMEVYLKAKGIWGIVHGDKQAPAADADQAAAIAFEQRERLAMAALVLSVDSSLVYLVMEAATSTAVWTALRGHFERTNVASVFYFLQRLFYTEMKEDTYMTDHLKSFKELCDKLAAVGREVEDDYKVVVLLHSLPSSYAVLRTTLQTRGDALRLEEVEQVLLAEDQQRRSGMQSSTGHATEAALRAAGRGRGAFRGGGRGRRGGRGGNFNSSQGSQSFDGSCNHCGIYGHRYRDCKKRKNEGGGRRGRAEHAGAAQENNACQHTLFIAGEDKCYHDANLSLVVDSGASSHMTAEKGLLNDYNIFPTPKQVRQGDGRAVVALGSGSVEMSLFVNEQATTATLTNVLCVPKLAANLFSVKAIVAKGFTVEFGGDACYVKNPSGHVLAVGHLGRNLYVLDGKSEKPEEIAAPALASTVKEELQLWHARLGHVGE